MLQKRCRKGKDFPSDGSIVVASTPRWKEGESQSDLAPSALISSRQQHSSFLRMAGATTVLLLSGRCCLDAQDLGDTSRAQELAFPIQVELIKP